MACLMKRDLAALAFELRAAYMPDAARAVSGHPPSLIPEEGSPPGFGIV
jgi:hypothetical protein